MGWKTILLRVFLVASVFLSYRFDSDLERVISLVLGRDNSTVLETIRQRALALGAL